jgi:pimeloyl-ACP methyl ester carboxylesterase
MHHLIFLHGAIGSKDELEPLSDKFSDEFHVHLLNFSGHAGEEACAEEFSIPSFADEVLNYMCAHHIQKAVFFGYSMGGYVAMYIARHFPVFVDKVITLGTKFLWDEQIAARETKMLNPEVIETKLPAFAEELRQRHHPLDWKEVLSNTSKMLIEMGKDNPLALDDFKQVSHPCLLLLGENDKMVTAEETLAIHNALPHSTYKQLPDTPHLIGKVDTNLLHNSITNFIAEKCI